MKEEAKHKTEPKQSNQNHENVKPAPENNYLELAQRLKAEFDNYKRRNENIQQESFNNGVATLTKKLLPAIDSFNQAKQKITDKTVTDGLDMILAQLLGAFESVGITPIKAEGQEFDPNIHNAVLTGVDETKPNGIVLEEYQQGFRLGDIIIRHSVVKINKLS